MHLNRPQLTDRFGRSFDYLRIAVAEKCNLRCIYCMPEKGMDFQPNHKLLSAAEIQRILTVTAELGVKKVRFTGGEPLIRKDILQIIKDARAISGIEEVHLTTNGLLLHKVLPQLSEIGISGINISLDTLDAARFLKLTRREGLETVLNNIKLALATGIPKIKLNMVVLKEFNSDEILPFVELTRELPLTVRFIELMPFDDYQIWETGQFLSAKAILKIVQNAYPDLSENQGTPTEFYHYELPGHVGQVAVIPAFSRDMCGSCNRIRLTADGRIMNCLYAQDEFNLRDIMRNKGTDKQIARIFQTAMMLKAKDGFATQKITPTNRSSMSMIGG